MATLIDAIPANVMAVLTETARQSGTTLDAEVARWQAAVDRGRDATQNQQFLADARESRDELASAGVVLAEGEAVRLIREGREARA